ncbi:WW domain-binding protein 2-like [Dendronephthya gigantea]|uniref:WW domain-binding protein 2-like n=1 Tax=Dendronephthya gigantea TaxID=151771 RepID=UPI00106C9633|nr:WW domain-binding protein 2-like [Dendronephthya gigantea]
MAVNQTKSQNGQLFLTNDFVISDKNGVEFSFEKSANLPGYLLASRTGRLILTGQKVIFVNAKATDQCQTITMAFHYIRNLEIKQPIFGANYLQADITAEPGAGWQGDAVFKVVFSKGGAIEFAEAFQRAVRNARAGHHPAMQQPPMNGHYFIPPQPQQQPNPGYYGYPAAGYAQPPPYQPQPYPPQFNGAPPMQYNQYQSGVPPSGKAAEAYASGQNVYVPAPQGNFATPSAPPPPYEESAKKDQ